MLSESLFWQFPIGANLVSMAAFVIFAAPLTWLAWKRPAWAEKYRVQNKPSPIAATFGRVLQTWVVNNALLFVFIVASWPLLRLTAVHAGPAPGVLEILWQLVFFIFLDDVLYFFFHRTLHRPAFYKRIHLKHHTIAVPYAAMGHYMSAVEFVATASVALAGPILVGAHVITLWVWVVFRQLEAAEAHCGYDFPFSPARLFPGYQGTGFHDFHHSQFVGNFSGFAGLMERVLTRFKRPAPIYAKGYLEYLQRD